MKYATIVALAVLATLAGCGGGGTREAEPLGLTELGDTTGITRGAPLLDRFQTRRTETGAVEIRGAMDLPDGTRIQVSLYRRGAEQAAGRAHAYVRGHRFVSPPIMGERGPLPQEDYRIEVLTFFNDAWQTEAVMRATHDGRTLRGPGVTRDGTGAAAYRVVEERRL